MKRLREGKSWGRGPAGNVGPTCRHGQLRVDLVHKHFPAGLDLHHLEATRHQRQEHPDRHPLPLARLTLLSREDLRPTGIVGVMFEGHTQGERELGLAREFSCPSPLGSPGTTAVNKEDTIRV